MLVTGPGLASGGAEVPLVAAEHPDAVVLRDGSATVEGCLRAMDGAELVHVAAHGRFRGDNPMFSALELADGPLTVHDFERLRRAPHRFVLSACDSGVLVPVGANELLGLATALMSMGTAGILASVAPVNDEATVELMVDVHRGLDEFDDLGVVMQRVRERAAVTSSARRRPRPSWRWGSDSGPPRLELEHVLVSRSHMSIGISEEHVELARSLREWAASLGGREAARDAEGDAGRDVRRRLEGRRRDGRGHDRAARGGRWRRRLGARPGGGAGGVRPRAGARPAARSRRSRARSARPSAESLGEGAVVGLVHGLVATMVVGPPRRHPLPAPGRRRRLVVAPPTRLTTSRRSGVDLSRASAPARWTRSPGSACRGLDAELVRRTVVTFAAAEAAGVARWCLETAVDYAKVREQFGQKIGAFQAIKHLCAEMLETAEAVTAAAWDVACRCSSVTTSSGRSPPTSPR